MTAEIVNLRRARKAKVRSDKAKRADENRARFGRTKAEKEREDVVKRLDERRLDGHEREEPSKD